MPSLNGLSFITVAADRSRRREKNAKENIN
jgi:hypothetical protein